MAIMRREGQQPVHLMLRPAHVHATFILIRRLLEADAEFVLGLAKQSERRDTDIILTKSGAEWDDLGDIRVRATVLHELCLYTLTEQGRAKIIYKGVTNRPTQARAVLMDDPADSFVIPPSGLVWTLQNKPFKIGTGVPAIHIVREFVGGEPGSGKFGTAHFLCGHQKRYFRCEAPVQEDIVQYCKIVEYDKTMQEAVAHKTCKACRKVARGILSRMDIDYGQFAKSYKGRRPE